MLWGELYASFFLFSLNVSAICEVRFIMGYARPRLMGCDRFIFGPSSTVILEIYKCDSSNFKSFTAEAAALFNNFSTGVEVLFTVKCSKFRASCRFFPRTKSTTNLAFLGATRRLLNWTLISIIYYLAVGFVAVSTLAAVFWSAPASISRCIFPPCRENLVVGENSPNLCPTMSSPTSTGINSFPLCTPKVKPTISGEIDECRDQVLITTFSSLRSFKTFSNNRWSTNGPFLKLLDMVLF